MSDPRAFDGAGVTDALKAEAARIVDCAVGDEIEVRGHADMSETFGCFLEFRIEEALRIHLGSDQ